LFERIIIQQKNIIIILPKGENDEYYKEKFTVMMKFIMDNHHNQIKFTQEKETLKLLIANRFENPEKVFEFLFKFTKDIRNIISE